LFRIAAQPSIAPLCLFVVLFAIPPVLTAQFANRTPGSADSLLGQNAPDQNPKIAQPGELGSPFPVEHSWNHFALELSGGYTPLTQKGAGYFDRGFSVTAGVVDHIAPFCTLMVEANIFGMSGSKSINTGSSISTSNYSNTVFAPDFAVGFDFLSRARTSPYAIGGIGYYVFGPVTLSGTSPSSLTAISAANAVGYNGGGGVRHRLYSEKNISIFAEARYHHIASGSTAFGQISLLPVSAGIRW
jgi:hypothetical protein